MYIPKRNSTPVIVAVVIQRINVQAAITLGERPAVSVVADNSRSRPRLLIKFSWSATKLFDFGGDSDTGCGKLQEFRGISCRSGVLRSPIASIVYNRI